MCFRTERPVKQTNKQTNKDLIPVFDECSLNTSETYQDQDWLGSASILAQIQAHSTIVRMVYMLFLQCCGLPTYTLNYFLKLTKCIVFFTCYTLKFHCSSFKKVLFCKISHYLTFLLTASQLCSCYQTFEIGQCFKDYYTFTNV